MMIYWEGDWLLLLDIRDLETAFWREKIQKDRAVLSEKNPIRSQTWEESFFKLFYFSIAISYFILFYFIIVFFVNKVKLRKGVNLDYYIHCICRADWEQCTKLFGTGNLCYLIKMRNGRNASLINQLAWV